MSAPCRSAACVTRVEADLLSIDHIRRVLETERVGFHTYLFGEVDSTNAVLRRLAERGAPDGTTVITETQTDGRGRHGKRWFSPAGLNLYVSVLFRPPIDLASVAVFSFISSLAATDAIWAEGLLAAIKWPNDILVDGRKVGGTLTTLASAGDGVEYVILGVGVNVNVEREALTAALGTDAARAGSLRDAAGRAIDRNAFTAGVLNHLEAWNNRYRSDGPDGILAAWRERDALTGHRVEIRGESGLIRGRATGINDHGRLVVEDEIGASREILTGEVVIAD